MDGLIFDSKAEGSLYQLLKAREKAGLIKDIKCQTTVFLTAARILYRCDFCFTDIETDTTIWAEFKGFPTDTWKIKKRLWKHYGPGRLEIWGGHYSNIKLTEVLEPKS